MYCYLIYSRKQKQLYALSLFIRVCWNNKAHFKHLNRGITTPDCNIGLYNQHDTQYYCWKSNNCIMCPMFIKVRTYNIYIYTGVCVSPNTNNFVSIYVYQFALFLIVNIRNMMQSIKYKYVVTINNVNNALLMRRNYWTTKMQLYKQISYRCLDYS